MTNVKGKKTYYAQSTYILPIQGQSNKFIAMFDKWNKLDLQNSRYIWLPLTFENGKMILQKEDGENYIVFEDGKIVKQ